MRLADIKLKPNRRRRSRRRNEKRTKLGIKSKLASAQEKKDICALATHYQKYSIQ